MNLTLQRTRTTDNSVFGELFINDKFACYTLEDKIRDVKIKHETCIPAGIYNVVLSLSQRFKVILPLLLNVPGFEGIRIHSGNTIAATSGCVLVGTSIQGNKLLHSKPALYKLLETLTKAFKKGSITITVINPVEPVKEQPKEIIVEVKSQEIIVPVILQEIKKNKFTISTFIKWLLTLISRNS